MPIQRIEKGLVYSVIAVALVLAVVIAGQRVLAQVCQSSQIDSLSRFQNKTRDANGNIHITVAYAGGGTVPDPTIKQSMEAAIAEWNSFSSTTKVVFDLAQPNTTADLEFAWTDDTSKNGSCAKFDPNTVRIYHGPEMEARLASLGQNEVTVVFKHEVGHFLGLGHTTSPATIMNQPSAGSTCTNGTTSDKTVDSNDATQVVNCISVVNPTPTPTPTPTPPQSCPDNCPNPQAYPPATCFGGVDWCLYPDSGCESGLEANGRCCCSANTPILIDLSGDGFDLTDLVNGVDFDISSVGMASRVSWTLANSDDAFLTLDRNGNGVIDSGAELFGNVTPQSQPQPGVPKNGFFALAEYDKSENGGNADGMIDQRDSVYGSLRLWRDANHNAVSEPAELSGLSDAQVEGISLDFKESRRQDRWGNRYRYRAHVYGSNLGRWAYDVVFLSGPAQ